MSKEATTRILVIEDDPDGCRSVAEAMQEAGYAVATAATGETGIRLFKEQAFDAVLSDIRLPDLDGQKVLERLKVIKADVPVLLMTAYGTVSAAVAALKDCSTLNNSARNGGSFAPGRERVCAAIQC